VNGVSVSESDRRKAEDEYLKLAKQRDQQRARGGGPPRQGGPPAPQTGDPADVESLIKQSRHPEVMASRDFLRFKFQQGKYALVGREKFEGLDVLKIEYYPTRLFSHDQDQVARSERQGRAASRSQQEDATFERMLNKVSLVTIWVEPNANQIV